MRHNLPASMSALASVERGVELVQRPVPTPKRGEVLVHMRAAPINPNDLMMLDGTYEVKKPIGTIAGFEGTGTVVASGGGFMARYLLGRDVACAERLGNVNVRRTDPWRMGHSPSRCAPKPRGHAYCGRPHDDPALSDSCKLRAMRPYADRAPRVLLQAGPSPP